MRLRVNDGYGYVVSDLGEVFSIKTIGKKLRPFKNKKGYLLVKLYSDGKHKTIPVHRLVIETFYGKSEKQINHKDGDKSNNSIDNLEYCTMEENMAHAFETGLKKRGSEHHFSKLNEGVVVEIKSLFHLGFSDSDLASNYGVSRRTIGRIRNNQKWRHV